MSAANQRLRLPDYGAGEGSSLQLRPVPRPGGRSAASPRVRLQRVARTRSWLTYALMMVTGAMALVDLYLLTTIVPR